MARWLSAVLRKRRPIDVGIESAETTIASVLGSVDGSQSGMRIAVVGDCMQTPEDKRLAVSEALVALSAADLPYSDLYLHRAEILLGGLARFAVVCRNRLTAHAPQLD
jgi:hypothetical protein